MTFKYRYRKQIALVILIIILIGGGITTFCLSNKKTKTSTNQKILVEKKVIKKKESTKIEEESQTTEIMVDVKGEVNTPGIYKLSLGSRVIDAINMAGGLTTNADTSVLNLSKKLTDEMVILVYSYYEVKNLKQVKETETLTRENCKKGNGEFTNDACIDNQNSSTINQKISLNNATIEELMTLSGIGEAKAQNIIKYREDNGGFKTIDELKEVEGIGEALFAKIKENITV